MRAEAAVNPAALEADEDAVIDIAPLGIWIPALEALLALAVGRNNGIKGCCVFWALRHLSFLLFYLL